MKVSLNIQKNRRNSKGEFDIFIVVRNNGSRFMLKTDFSTPIVFDGREFPKSISNHAAKTSKLNKLLLSVEEFAYNNDSLTMDELKTALARRLYGKEPKAKLFADYIGISAERQNNLHTRQIYYQTRNKVAEFDAEATFDTITPDWLSRFERHWLQSMKVNGVAKLLRTIRAVFNDAIDDEVTSKYPFRKFKITHERTRKRSLTAEQLRLLRDYPVEGWQEEYRDMFMLIFYLIGINISDLLELESLTDGRCVYHRNKTGRLYDIAVPDEAMAIINKYRGESHLLCPLDRYKTANAVNDYTHHINDALKKIGPTSKGMDKAGKMRKKVYQPLFPEISTYWARHTWASIAASLDIPKETIGKALGHSDFDSSTTDIYIDFDMRKIDEANRKVIDFVNKK